MEFFANAKTVKFRSHEDRYLVADDDEITVRQSRNGTSRNAHWTVEFVEAKNNIIRLKSCHGRYLTPSEKDFLLGMTGQKVIQTVPATEEDSSVEWEPIKEKESELVKLRTNGGKFLRANWGLPPYRNSVTHDIPCREIAEGWILWKVDVVDTCVSDSESSSTDVSPASITPSPSIASLGPAQASGRRDGMKFFDKAKVVRLQSHLGKYLVADDNVQTLKQNRNESSQKAHWTVEYVEGKDNVIRLKSCHGSYLTATNQPFLLGLTGNRVLQTFPSTNMDTAATEWEPIKQGSHVKFRSSEGNFLRANYGSILTPWRNSITCDVPHIPATQDWVLWEVDVVEFKFVSSRLSVSSILSTLSDVVSGRFGYASRPRPQCPAPVPNPNAQVEEENDDMIKRVTGKNTGLMKMALSVIVVKMLSMAEMMRKVQEKKMVAKRNMKMKSIMAIIYLISILCFIYLCVDFVRYLFSYVILS